MFSTIVLDGKRMMSIIRVALWTAICRRAVRSTHLPLQTSLLSISRSINRWNNWAAEVFWCTEHRTALYIARHVLQCNVAPRERWSLSGGELGPQMAMAKSHWAKEIEQEFARNTFFLLLFFKIAFNRSLYWWAKNHTLGYIVLCIASQARPARLPPWWASCWPTGFQKSYYTKVVLTSEFI